jgi:hypothetical protein
MENEMPTARSRLADIEGPGLGKPLGDADIRAASDRLRAAVALGVADFLRDVAANKKQTDAAVEETICFLSDLIADATGRQLREIEGEEDG